MKLEHVASRSGHPALVFVWRNLVGVCPGDAGGAPRPPAGRYHCDTFRGSAALPGSPVFPPDISKWFSYTITGEVRPARDCPAPADARAMIQALNLNHPRLCANRSAVLNATRRRLQAQSFSRLALDRLLFSATTLDASGYLQEYCGVIAHYVTKKLRQRG